MKPLIGVVIGSALAVVMVLGLERFAPDARAEESSADTSIAPFVTLTPAALCKFWSNQAAANAVNGDAGWNTAMGQLFSSANWPGVNAQSLAFLRSFFIQYVHVGSP